MKEEKKSAKPSVKKQEKVEAKQKPNYLYSVVAAIVIIAAAVILFLGTSKLSTASFSSFKQNFNSAPRVSIVVYYQNATSYGQEVICSTDLIEILASHRAPSTIEFFTIENNTCSYIPNGLGAPGNVITNSTAACLKTVAAEPSISLNYSATNSTVITSDSLNIHGNAAYMASCPIAVDLS
jgi:hypothetical protein